TTHDDLDHLAVTQHDPPASREPASTEPLRRDTLIIRVIREREVVMPTATRSERLVFFHDADVVIRSPEMLGELSEALDVVVPAYPGFEGYFDMLGRRWESWDSAADLAQHFRQTVFEGDGSAPAHLAGAGFGGWVALELALMMGRSLESLVLVAPYGVKLFGPMDREFCDILLLDPHEQVELGWAEPARCRGLRMPGFPADLPDSEHEV